MKSFCFLLAFFALGSGCNAAIVKDADFIEQLINSEQLNGYWHIEHFPERVPLTIYLPPDVDTGDTRIEKFSQPVEFTREPPESRVALFVDAVNKEDSVMSVDFSYPPEGLRGQARYKAIDGKWKLVDLTLHES